MLDKKYIYNYIDARTKILKILEDYYGSLTTYKIENEDYSDYSFEFPLDKLSFKEFLQNNLTDREYDILVSCYGAFGNSKKTLDEKALEYNISKERVRQIKILAIEKLKKAYKHYGINLEIPFDCQKVKKFLKKILTSGELENFCLEYPIFASNLNSEKILNEEVLKKALKKIRYLFENIKVEFPIEVSELRSFLEKNLTEKEFKVFCFTNGLFDYPQLKFNDISSYVAIPSYRIVEVNNTCYRKIKSSFANYFDVNEIRNYLNQILSKYEFIFFSHYFGIFTCEKKTVTEMANIYNISTTTIRNKINTACEKIKIMIEFAFLKPFDYLEVEEFLKNILTEKEYLYLCLRFGLFGSLKIEQEKVVRFCGTDYQGVFNTKESINNKIKKYLSN